MMLPSEHVVASAYLTTRLEENGLTVYKLGQKLESIVYYSNSSARRSTKCWLNSYYTMLRMDIPIKRYSYKICVLYCMLTDAEEHLWSSVTG